MNIALRCGSCGLDFVADNVDSAKMPCPGCGSSLGPARKTEAALPRKAVVRTKAPPTPAPPEAAARPQPTDTGSAAPTEIVCPRCNLHFTPRAAKHLEPHSQRHTVLVVEDMDYFRDIARDALEPDYVVEEAETVQEAQAALLAGEIDLILLDLTLGDGEDGARLLHELPFKPCPILIFTAEDESVMYGEQWDKLQELGADDVVIKGMNVGESILRKVGSLLGDGENGEGSTTV